MRLKTKKCKFLLKNLFLSLVFIGFSFYSFVSPTLAQTNPNPSLKTSTPIQTISNTPSSIQHGTQPTAATASVASDKNGKVLFCVDPTGLTCGIGDTIGAIVKLPEKLFEFISGKLAEIVGKIILYFAHIVDGMFGGGTEEACKEADGSAPDPKCTSAAAQLATIDPFFKQNDGPSLTSKINLFTIADSSYSTLYRNIPDIHATTEIASVFQNNVLGIGTVHAQGEGTNNLGGVIKEIWQKMRDLAYIFMVLVLVTIGLMVMLRRRLDPKTVVTATSSLPKVAIALVLITFSFAISGFFIDLIYLLVGLTRSYFGSLPGLAGFVNFATEKIGGGEFLWLPLFTLLSKSIFSFKLLLAALLPILTSLVLTGGIAAFALIIPIIAILGIDILIRLGLFILAVMLFWSLLTRYATLVLLAVFSPFFFLAGALPGFENATSDWFKRMFAVVITFPIILIIAYLALALLSPSLPGIPGVTGNNGIGAPPPIGGTGLILNIQALLGLGVLYFAHKVPGMIDKFLKTEGSKDRGPGPLIVAGAAMSGMKNYSAISKGAPQIGSFLGGMAGNKGIMGNLAGGALTFVRPFAPGHESIPSTQSIMNRRANQPRPKGEPLAANLTSQRGGSASPASPRAFPGLLEETDAANSGVPSSVTLPGLLNEVDERNAPTVTPPAAPPRERRSIISRLRVGGNRATNVTPNPDTTNEPNNSKDPNENPNFRP